MPYVVELDLHDPADSQEKAVYFALGPGLALPDTDWIAPGLNRWSSPTQKVTLGTEGIVSSSVDQGIVEISNQPTDISVAGPYDQLLSKVFQGRSAVLWQVGTTWAGRQLIATAIMEQPIASLTLGGQITGLLQFPLRDPRVVYDVAFQGTKYAGTNANGQGVEGTASDLLGKPKPVLYGKVSNIAGIVVNSSLQIYQLADKAITVDCARDGGIGLTLGVVRANLASMQATAPTAGTYDTYAGAEGTFVRFGTKPVNQVTFDASEGANAAVRTHAQIWSRIRTERCGTAAGTIEAASVAAADALDAGEAGFWWSDELTQLDALNEVLSAFSGYEVFTTLEQWRVAKLVAAAGASSIDLCVLTEATVLTSKSRPLSMIQSVRPDYTPNGAPPYRVNVQWGRNYTVMATSAFVGAAIQRLRDKFSVEWRTFTETNTAVWDPTANTGLFPNAAEMTIQTGYAQDDNGNCPAAGTEAVRLATLFTVLRGQWQVGFRIEPGDRILPGDVVSMTMASYGLSNGGLFRVLQSGITLDTNGLRGQLVIGLQA